MLRIPGQLIARAGLFALCIGHGVWGVAKRMHPLGMASLWLDFWHYPGKHKNVMKITINYENLQDEEAAAVRAALAYIARKNRDEHPSGEFDSAQRWEPDLAEKSPYVLEAREPSHRWPYSRLLAARSLKHCAWLHDADEMMVRDVVGLLLCKPTKAGLKRLKHCSFNILGQIADKRIQEKIHAAVISKL